MVYQSSENANPSARPDFRESVNDSVWAEIDELLDPWPKYGVHSRGGVMNWEFVILSHGIKILIGVKE
jgi:hypothetical protein